MCVNTDNEGECEQTLTHPWIELWNRSDEAVDLEGWGLSDDLSDTDKYALGEITIGADSRTIVQLPVDGQIGDTGVHLSNTGGVLLLSCPTSDAKIAFGGNGGSRTTAYGATPPGTGQSLYGGISSNQVLVNNSPSPGLPNPTPRGAVIALCDNQKRYDFDYSIAGESWYENFFLKSTDPNASWKKANGAGGVKHPPVLTTLGVNTTTGSGSPYKEENLHLLHTVEFSHDPPRYAGRFNLPTLERLLPIPGIDVLVLSTHGYPDATAGGTQGIMAYDAHNFMQQTVILNTSQHIKPILDRAPDEPPSTIYTAIPKYVQDAGSGITLPTRDFRLVLNLSCGGFRAASNKDASTNPITNNHSNRIAYNTECYVGFDWSVWIVHAMCFDREFWKLVNANPRKNIASLIADANDEVDAMWRESLYIQYSVKEDGSKVIAVPMCAGDTVLYP